MTSDTTTPDDAGLAAAQRAVVLVGAACALGFGAAFGFHFGLGVAVGALVAAANLWAVSRVVRAFLSGASPLPWTLLSLFKLCALFGGMYLMLRAGLPVLPLVIGLGALPVGITAAQLRSAPAAQERG